MRSAASLGLAAKINGVDRNEIGIENPIRSSMHSVGGDTFRALLAVPCSRSQADG
jgi:hypothetical protein